MIYNENLDLAYLFALASDSIPSDTSTDKDGDHVSAIDTLISLYALISHSLCCMKRSVMCKEPFLKYPSNTRVKSQSYSRETSKNQWLVKVQKTMLSLHNSFITGEIHTI